MSEILEQGSSIESTTVAVGRTSSTVKGGRRFSFGALVIVGDRHGKVGFGYGKSNEVPNAVEKAQKYGKRSMKPVPVLGTTIPHEVEGGYSSTKVRLVPAAPGTGVVAGSTVRAILEMAGISDCITKCYGSTNKLNVVKAVFDGLGQLRPVGSVASLRKQTLGLTSIEEKIERGKRYMPAAGVKRERAKGPVNTVGDDRRGGRGGRGGPRRRGPGGPGGSEGATPSEGAPAAPKA